MCRETCRGRALGQSCAASHAAPYRVPLRDPESGAGLVEKQLGNFTRLQGTLEKILAEAQPDCVISTYPVYAHVIQKIYRDHERPFSADSSRNVPGRS